VIGSKVPDSSELRGYPRGYPFCKPRVAVNALPHPSMNDQPDVEAVPRSSTGSCWACRETARQCRLLRRGAQTPWPSGEGKEQLLQRCAIDVGRVLRIDKTLSEVLRDDREARLVQRAGYRSELRDDIAAVAVSFNHSDDTGKLAGRAAQPVDQCGLSAAPVGVEPAALMAYPFQLPPGEPARARRGPAGWRLRR
jgi:hypothetical protein